MDLEGLRVDGWLIETAQMKHAARKNSMSAVAQSYLRGSAAEFEIEKYQDFLKSISDDPAAYETLSENERDFYDLSSSVGVWALVAGCIKPYIPLSEWLTFDDNVVEKLSLAVQQVNPHWFEVSPETEKKTKKPRKRPTKS